MLDRLPLPSEPEGDAVTASAPEVPDWTVAMLMEQAAKNIHLRVRAETTPELPPPSTPGRPIGLPGIGD
jgi:hypothetical protein